MTVQLILILLVLAGVFVWFMNRDSEKRKRTADDEDQGGGVPRDNDPGNAEQK